MSDRSYCTFTVRAKDAKKVAKLEEPDYMEDEVTAGCVTLQYQELVGGGYDLAAALRDKRIAYLQAFEGVIGAYPSGVAAFNGKLEVEFLAVDGRPALLADELTDELTDEAVSEFRAKLADYRAVKALITGE